MLQRININWVYLSIAVRRDPFFSRFFAFFRGLISYLSQHIEWSDVVDETVFAG